MKNFRLFSLLTLAAVLSLGACKETAKDDARADITATPATTNPATNPNTAATPPIPAGPLTQVNFAEKEFDYGEIMEGEKVTHVYNFTNTGDEPLIISNAKGSCGCTVPDWPREPIAPGEDGEIKVVFDSKNKGKVGGNPQSKRVTITANTDPANTYLTIKGIVNRDEQPNS